MAEEKKLGPGVTYLGNDDEDKAAVTMAGIRFKPGESVNVEERLGEEGAKDFLKSLSGNRFFKVDGGPDHRAQAEAKAKGEQQDAEDARKEAEEKAGYKPPEENQLEKPARKKPGTPTFE